jgi:ethanolamine transporter EutH
VGEGLLVELDVDTWLHVPVVLGVIDPESVTACEPVALGVGARDDDCEYVPPGVMAWLPVATWLGVDDPLGVRVLEGVAN